MKDLSIAYQKSNRIYWGNSRAGFTLVAATTIKLDLPSWVVIIEEQLR
jgi:hypothetical protein